ncbi:MAG TPA: hypothetical protein VFO83_06070 [Aggregicoccus sp.]|nr:hypothetical protein [Aggregicoccus sp.]
MDIPSELQGWPWGQRMLARIEEMRSLAALFAERAKLPADAPEAEATRRCLDRAQRAIVRGSRRRPRAPCIAAAQGYLHTAAVLMLQTMPLHQLQGRLPELYARVEEQLPPGDARRVALEALYRRLRNHGEALDEAGRELLVSAAQAAFLEEERALDRVRRFRNLVYGAAGAACLLAVLLALFMARNENLAPLCFSDEGVVSCPSASGAIGELVFQLTSRWDYALVEMMGLVAATLTAAVALSGLRAAGGPYDMVLPLFLLKVPTGALTAVLGLLLVQGGFVPGLTALDSPSQILAWAAVFGAGQQLFTRLVDRHGATLLPAARAAPGAPVLRLVRPQPLAA